MTKRLTRRTFLGGAGSLAAFGPARLLAKSYTDTTSWDPFVPEIRDTDTYLRRKFRQNVTDRTTGLDVPELKKLLAGIVADGKAAGESWRITKAKCFAAQATRMAIDVSPLDWFPAISVWDRRARPIGEVTGNRAREVNRGLIPPEVNRAWGAGNASGEWCMWQDFDHSVPDWRVIFKLGFPGLRDRLERIVRERGNTRGGGALAPAGNVAQKGASSSCGGEDAAAPRAAAPRAAAPRAAAPRAAVSMNEDPFYEGLRLSIDAALACIDRFIAQAEKNDSVARLSPSPGHARLAKEIACLKRLRAGAPQTAYDAMMFVWLYFFFSEHLDGIQCRSLTEIDVCLTPYYEADLAAGRTTEGEFREQFKHWLWQWGSISNYWNQPVGLGGTKADGTSEYNHLSKIILEVMDACALSTPKFLAKIAPNTPDWALDKMLDMARRHRSICFIGEEPTAKALKRLYPGATDQDCREMVVKGCYEFSLRDAANDSGAGHVNFLKPVERMLQEATSPTPPAYPTFDAFKDEYLRRLADVTTRCRKVAEWTEKALPDVNPANMMTLSTEHALRTRRDGYANGCPRGNGSGILAVGPGTTVDALLAVKELVYEKKELTLAELGRIMSANWKGHEALRLRMLRSKRKWGNNDPEANALGGELVKTFAAQLNGFPNARGGFFAASGHCARQYIHLGSKTGATPDGRKKGEEMSKNLSPTMGADTEGATALVMTLANSGATARDLPGDFPLDVMMHPSACEGQRGLEAMKAIVRLFHRNGGSVVQFTVFSAEELRDAQTHPEKYEDLQVRVCGWNVRWNDMTREEQNAYIRRAESIRIL